MQINHIFMFCDNHDEVAKELIAFGFSEGSSRVHENQGTRNRKFYFDNFYLEILWVHNIEEVTSPLTAPTKLYERSHYTQNGMSPFGLCLNDDIMHDILFNRALVYKPTYLPKGMEIEVLTNEKHSSLPWTFRWQGQELKKNSNQNESTSNKILTKVSFGIARKDMDTGFVNSLNGSSIDFFISDIPSVVLEFDNAKSKKRYSFKSVPLVLLY